MPDSWWDESPIIQHERAVGEAKVLREMVVDVVRLRFPALTELVKKKVTWVDKPEVLKKLHEQAVLAPDEASIRQLLDPTTS